MKKSVNNTLNLNFLITGGGFINKGAESMVYTTILEIKKRFPNSKIYIGTKSKDIKENVENIVMMDDYIVDFCLNIKNKKLNSNNKSIAEETLKTICKIDFILDVSGYALFDGANYNMFLERIELAKKYKIPIYLLPQSFGPIIFGKVDIKERARMISFIEYPRMIFAREKEGYKFLKENFKNKNVYLKNDIVLQSKEEYSKSFASDKNHLFEIENGSVGIIPNKRILDKTSTQINELYIKIIDFLLEKTNRDICILYHSLEDREICQEVYNMFLDNERVKFYDEDLDCVGFQNLVGKFAYVVASRYHSIVHAYKKSVPCIVIGWADKYCSLLEKFRQTDYFLDARYDIEDKNIFNKLERLETNKNKEIKVIKKILSRIQKESVFNFVEKDIIRTKENEMNKKKISPIKRCYHKVVNQIVKKYVDPKLFDYYTRFMKHSFYRDKCNSKESYEALITKCYHSIEKGLSSEDYRPGFGKKNVNTIINLINKYVCDYGDINQFFYKTAISCLEEYVKKNKEYNYEDIEINKKIQKLIGESNDKGGIIRIVDNEINKKQDYKELLESRHSVRHFSEKPVEIENIKKAIELAQRTPSACNRQGWKSRIIYSKEIINNILENQNGNKGFGNEIDKLIVITSDLRYFNREREMFQPYIDGGMYAMNIINSLYYYGIASIPLSASLTMGQEKNIKNC